MKKIYCVALLALLLLVMDLTTLGATVKASESSVQVKEKVYFEWFTHSSWQNQTGEAIVRIKTVDYGSGLFSTHDTVVDFVDKSKEYYFKSTYGLNTKRPWINFVILKNGNTERIVKFDSNTKSLSIIVSRNSKEGTIDEVYPDADMYVVEKGKREYLVYSLSTNKLIHKAKEQPTQHSSLFTTNVLFRNYFYPEPTVGSLYVQAGQYYDPKRGYVTYSGEYPYEIKPDGSKLKLQSYRESSSVDYVYKRTLQPSVVYKQTSKKRYVKHELIIQGKSHTLLESNTHQPNYAFGIEQFSPHGKYVVIWVNFTENGRRVKGKEEYRIFGTSNGKLIQTIPINSTGSSSAIDFGMSWMGNTDHIIQSGLLNFGAYRVVGTDLLTPRRYGNASQFSSSYHYTFELDNYLTVNDPIPVKFRGKYLKYRGQGSFRTPDLTILSPVSELVELLDGTMESNGGRIILKYQDRSFTLNSTRQIIWKNQSYYPLREILNGLGLKLLSEGNFLASEEWKEMRIIE